MAPEQAQGKSVDRRADVWAFGVVLFEMLTGRRAFTGRTTSEVLAAVINQPAPLDALPAGVPEPIRRLLRRCLEKERRNRLSDLATARLEIREALTTGLDSKPARRSHVAGLGIALGAVVALAVGAFVWWGPDVANAPAVEFEVRPPAGQMFTGPYGTTALSPDGHQVVFGAGPQMGVRSNPLWIRSLDSIDVRRLAGTEGAGQPFWSPDGRSIGFFVGSPLKGSALKRMEVAGGPPSVIADEVGRAVSTGGAAWSPTGVVLVGTPEGLMRVPASGGTPEAVTRVDSSRKEIAHGYPQFLPGGDRFLYFVESPDVDVQGVYVASLSRPAQSTRILAGSSKAAFVPPARGQAGYLLWERDRYLIARVFDATTLTFSGEPTTLAANLAVLGPRAAFWVADAGTLAYRTGDDFGPKQLTWFDRSGRRMGEAAPADLYREVRLAPDGARAAVIRTADNRAEARVLEFDRGTWTRLSAPSMILIGPYWSSDGQRIALESDRVLRANTWNGVGPWEPLTTAPLPGPSVDWNSDGKRLLYRTGTPTNLWLLELGGNRPPSLVVDTPAAEGDARFSPDGKWIAYQSSDSGRDEVYVQGVDGRERWQVSLEGGARPRWRRDGRELFFTDLSGSSVMMSALETTSTVVKAGPPRRLFAIPSPLPAGVPGAYDVTPDGQRFLLMTSAGAAHGPEPLVIVLNWRTRAR
jgi:dipeptidyl aminopeptidase/acylaminoacyl peptidase